MLSKCGTQTAFLLASQAILRRKGVDSLGGMWLPLRNALSPIYKRVFLAWLYFSSIRNVKPAESFVLSVELSMPLGCSHKFSCLELYVYEKTIMYLHFL